jgi:hypothetical protein
MLTAPTPGRKRCYGRHMSRASLRPALATIVLALAPMSAVAAPPTEQPHVAIPPGREQAARDLLAPLLDGQSEELALRGPDIQRDRIEWWLMRGEQARARLLLVPRSAGEPEDPRSKSFALQIVWELGVEPDPAERALLEHSIESVQQRDEGGFYVLLPDTMLAHEEPPPPSGPYSRPIADDPDRTRGAWALQLAAVGLLLGFAVAVTLRPLTEKDPSRARRPG